MTTQWRFFITTGLGLGLAVIGILFRLPSFIALSIPAFIYSGSRLVSVLNLPEPDIQITRHPARVRFSEEDELPVTLVVRSHAPSTAFVGVSDLLPPALSVIDGDPSYFDSGTSEPAETRYTLTAPRGEYPLGPIRIRSWSRLGMAMRESVISLPQTLQCVPKVEPLPAITIRPRRTRAFAGPIRANVAGPGIDFFGSRAYTPGDDIRRVNWRTYALRDELVVTEFEQERIADVHLILDARARVHTQVGDICTFDHATRAAASLASHFIDQGNNVGLLIYGDFLHWVYPAIGRGQTERVLDALARAKIADKKAFEDLRQIPTRLFPPRSQLILISPLVGEADVEIIALLRARGYSLMLVCPDALPLERTAHPSTSATTLAERMLRLERDVFLESLAQLGVQVVDWPLDVPLSLAVQQISHRRGGRR